MRSQFFLVQEGSPRLRLTYMYVFYLLLHILQHYAARQKQTTKTRQFRVCSLNIYEEHIHLLPSHRLHRSDQGRIASQAVAVSPRKVLNGWGQDALPSAPIVVYKYVPPCITSIHPCKFFLQDPSSPHPVLPLSNILKQQQVWISHLLSRRLSQSTASSADAPDSSKLHKNVSPKPT